MKQELNEFKQIKDTKQDLFSLQIHNVSLRIKK